MSTEKLEQPAAWYAWNDKYRTRKTSVIHLCTYWIDSVSTDKGEAVNTTIGNEAIQNLQDGANVDEACKEVKVGRLPKDFEQGLGTCLYGGD